MAIKFGNLTELAQALNAAVQSGDETTFMNLLQTHVTLPQPAEAPGAAGAGGVEGSAEAGVGLQTLLRRAPEPPRPEFFFGSDDKPPLVRAWLFQLRQYFRLWPSMADSEKIYFAVNLLRSHAMNWWAQFEDMARMGTIEEILTFEKFAEAITNQFGGFDVTEKARDQLAHMKQTSSVASYVGRFREALLLLGTDNYLDSDMAHRFILGLKPWIQRLVKIQAPGTLEKAMQMAERIDRVGMHGLVSVTERDPIFGSEDYSSSATGWDPHSDFVEPSGSAASSSWGATHLDDSAPTPMEIGAITAENSGLRRCANVERKWH